MGCPGLRDQVFMAFALLSMRQLLQHVSVRDHNSRVGRERPAGLGLKLAPAADPSSYSSAPTGEGPILTAEQFQFYESQGFLHAEGFFDAEETRLLRGYVDELQAAPEEKGGAMMYFEQSGVDGTRILNRIARDDYLDRLRTNVPSDGIFDDDVHDERARGEERVPNHTE